MKRKTITALGCLFLLVVLELQAITLSLNSKNGVYGVGDLISVTASFEEEFPSEEIQVKVLRNHNQTIYSNSIPLAEMDGGVIYEGSFEESCSLIIEATTGEQSKSVGLMVAPELIQPGFEKPADFDVFWENQKQQLAALPMETQMEPVVVDEGFLCYDTEINCIGRAPARGYFVKPEHAEVGTLPIVLTLKAAGVAGSWCRSNTWDPLKYAKTYKGALAFDLNAHGMLNGQEDSYYESLENGELKDYYYQGQADRDQFYFKDMYLRVLRTIEFLTQQPEWDGKRILVIGESQGGGQALAAAGLDSRVTAAVVTVPALCDLGGTLVERKAGWPNALEYFGAEPDATGGVVYADVAQLLKGSKATIVAEIGLIDQVCSSTSIYAAINQSEGEKYLYPVVYRKHSWPEGEELEKWSQTVQLAKNAFIEGFLN